MAIKSAKELKQIASDVVTRRAELAQAQSAASLEERYGWLFDILSKDANNGLASSEVYLTAQQLVDLKTELETAGYTVASIVTNTLSTTSGKGIITRFPTKTTYETSSSGFNSNRVLGPSNTRISWGVVTVTNASGITRTVGETVSGRG